jgi:hypothetical protein
LKTTFCHPTSYHVLDFVEEKIEVMVVQMMVKETIGSPNENT